MIRIVQIASAAMMAAVIMFVPDQALAPWGNHILVAAMVMSFSEYLVTHLTVRRFGIECEGNPLLRWVISWGGVYGMAGYWLLFWLAIWSFASPGAAAILLIFCGGLLVNNVLVFRALSEEQEAVLDR